MAEADVRLTSVDTGGAKIGNLIPNGSLSKEDGKSVIVGKWQVPGGGPSVDLTISGSDVRSVQTPFGGQPFMGEIAESEEQFGMHVTMGGFPMKAWLSKDGAQTWLLFSNGGRWSKL